MSTDTVVLGSSPRESAPVVPICEHIKDNGVRCKAPAVRGRHFCYHHCRAHAPGPRIGHRHYCPPLHETLESLQLQIFHITQALGSGRINEKVAGKLLYSVQLSTNILKAQAERSCSVASASSAPSPDPENIDAIVTEIPEAMQQVLTPPPDDVTQSEEENEIIAEPVPIPKATFNRITADLMTLPEIAAIRPLLIRGGESQEYKEASRVINAHWDAVAKLSEFGMSTHHPKLRAWFPRIPCAHQ